MKQARREATLRQWSELYEVAVKIKEFKPWKRLWDMDTITIILPNEMPIVCSIMGKGGEFCGIGAYIGINAIANLYKMAEKNDIPLSQIYRFQEDGIIMCNFGSREELSKEELGLIKELGYKFRGKNNWIYFQSYQKGFVPYMLDQEEVIQATEIFQHLFMALKAHLEGDLEVDFDGGHTLMRMYAPEEGLWMNFSAPALIPEPEYLTLTLSDELLVNKISKLKQNKNVWQFDVSFLNITIKEKKYEKPIIGKAGLLADKNTGLMITQNIISPDDDYVQAIFQTVIPKILDYGRPQKIITRDEQLYYILEDLCKRTKIKLKISSKLNVIDAFLEEYAAMNR